MGRGCCAQRRGRERAGEGSPLQPLSGRWRPEVLPPGALARGHKPIFSRVVEPGGCWAPLWPAGQTWAQGLGTLPAVGKSGGLCREPAVAPRHLAWPAGHQGHQCPHWTLRNLQRQWLGANLLEGTAPLMPETLGAAKKRAKEATFSPDWLQPGRLHPRFSRPGTANFLARTKWPIFSTLQARRSCYN